MYLTTATATVYYSSRLVPGMLTNTVFCVPSRYVVVDVIIRNRDMQQVRVTKAMRLIIAKLRLQMQPKRRLQCVKAPKCLTVNKMKADTIKQSSAATLKEHLEPILLDNQVMEWKQHGVRSV